MDPFLSEERPSDQDFPYVARLSAKWLFTMRMRKRKFMKHSSTSDKKVFTFREAQALYFGLLFPGKSFGLKFIPNQSDLFRNLYPRQSELIRVNPKKVFNLVSCNSVKNQSVSSESIRDFESE